MLWPDRIVTAGVVALVMLTPLAMGAVHPPAFVAAETTVFAMLALWILKLAWSGPGAIQFDPRHVAGLLAPLGVFAAIAAIQLLPLPPRAIAIASPATYRVYKHLLAGWPEQPPYSSTLDQLRRSDSAAAAVVLPTQSEVHSGAPIPAVQAPGAVHDSAAGETLRSHIWLPLSINPSESAGQLLKLGSYGALLILVLLYPFGDRERGDQERAFVRTVLLTVLMTGLIVSMLALIEQMTWNGKVLWTFVPYDWGAPNPVLADRARGSFVNPDHLAAFLNLVLPISVCGMLFPDFVDRRNREPLRVFSAITAFMVLAAVMMTLSRAGWIGAVIALITFVLLCEFVPEERRPALLRVSRKIKIPATLGIVACVVVFAALFVGSVGRERADARLHDTVIRQVSLAFRINVWRDTLAMVRDFPLFGIGLNCFQDLFAHYQSGPWSPASVNAAHNDYLQILIEAGLLGFAALAWFLWNIGTRLYRHLKFLPVPAVPVVAAIVGALASLAFHEFFDFGLQIPAIAIVATVLLGIALRLTGFRSPSRASSPALRRIAAPATVLAAALMIAAAMRQDMVPYPYNLSANPRSPAEAVARVLAHPASFDAHWALARLFGDRMTADTRVDEIERAVSLAPLNPVARDGYARTLLQAKRRRQALAEIELSVRNSPWGPDHEYLSSRLVPWLTEDERGAIERGFKQAVELHYALAVDGLGFFYEENSKFGNEGDLFASAARTQDDRAIRSLYLTRAGIAYAEIPENDRAETMWREAIRADPSSAKAYRYLIGSMILNRHNFGTAENLAAQAIDAGVDPVPLYESAAFAERRIGDRAAAEAFLGEALKLQPADYDLLLEAGSFYEDGAQFDRAALYMSKATEVRPNSAQAFYRLGVAEERAYNYFAADKAFARAIALAPENVEFRSHYRDFQIKLADRPDPDGSAITATDNGVPR